MVEMGGGYIYLEDLAALRAIARAFAAQRLSAARIAKWKHTQADGKAGRQRYRRMDRQARMQTH